MRGKPRLKPVDERKRGELAWAIVAGLLLCAGIWLRVSRLSWMQFGRDEEVILLRAFAAHQTWGAPFGVKSSAGFFMPPFLVDLFALPLLFTRDPVRIAAFVVAINLLGLAAFHVFVRRSIGAHTALWTSVLLASMPWAVLSSRSIWAPDCQFPLVAVLLLLLFSNHEAYSRWKTCAAIAVFGLLCQVHPSAWFLVPPLLVFAFTFRVRIPWTDIVLGFLILAVLYARWFVHEIGCGFDDIAWFLHARRSAGHGAPAEAGAAWGTLLWTLRATSGAGFEHFSTWVGTPDWVLPRAPLLVTLSFWAAVASTAGAIVFAAGWSASRLWNRARGGESAPRERAVVLSSLIVVLVLGGYALLRAAPAPHYAVILYPFLALLLAWSLEQASDRFPVVHGGWARIAIAGLALANCIFLWRFEAGVVALPGELSGHYGVPYAVRRDEWQRRLADGFDEVLHGEARRLERNEVLAREFEASTRVLLRLDASLAEPRIETQGSITVEPSKEGLLVRGGGSKNLLWLSAVAPPPGTVPMVRIDLTSPLEAELVLLYGTKDEPEISRRQMEIVPVPPGRSTHFVRIRRTEATGRIAMRFGVYRATIHGLEIRAVSP